MMVRKHSVTNIMTKTFTQFDRRAQFGKVVIVRGTNREKKKIHKGKRRGGMRTREAKLAFDGRKERHRGAVAMFDSHERLGD